MAELFFAQLREDTQVERAVVMRHRPARIACIASGGCGALSLLDDGVEVVMAIDLHKLTVVPAPLADALTQHEGFDALFLSNVFDWLDGDAREHTARAVLRAARPQAHVVTRHMLASSELPAALERALTPEAGELDLSALERSMLYRAVRHGCVW